MVAPSVTFLNVCVPLATVFTTRCSYMFKQKREMCTESVREVWYDVPVGIFMCKGHYVSTGYVLTVWSTVFLEEVLVSSRNEGLTNRKMKGTVTSRSP
jgi:hypothetical protein